jgi:UDP-N-acetylmuramoyl-L-alanyl-D-glutamate--2,6-diaminopimelate ligase
MEFTPTPTSLGSLVAATEGADLARGDPETRVAGITQDTRYLQPGDLFVAVPGLEQDGREFVPQAISRGAVAVVAEGFLETSVPLVVVPNARRALADLSAALYGQPSKALPVIGITGTDGKTSTTHLLSAILEAHGLRTGWLTTVNTKIGAELRPNAVDHTTPEAPVVQRTLAEMLAAGLQVTIVETSSHALDLERVRGVDFQVGVFTNLSPEHINFHGTFDAYRLAKRKLFEGLPPDGLAVLNADDPDASFMRAATCARVLTYGLDTPADITASNVSLSPTGTTFTLHTPRSSSPLGTNVTLETAQSSVLSPQSSARVVRTHLVGRFNVSNWLAAYAAATYFGASPDDLVHAAATQPPVPGRMNLVNAGQPFTVVVDFAHTPQALGKALDTVRSLITGRLSLAFGLAGGRDVANRPVMGALAARKSDFFVITMDDPGHEDASVIAEEIADGARAAGFDNFVVELDRRAAIRRLFERARVGDAVLLAGKGHEQRMVVGDERQPWNDAQAATEVLDELGFGIQAVP